MFLFFKQIFPVSVFMTRFNFPVFSYSSFPANSYPALHPLSSLDETCLSEEHLYTDDSSDSNGEDNGSGSESEDPTFILDTSQNPDAHNTLVSLYAFSLPTLSCVFGYWKIRLFKLKLAANLAVLY